MRRRPAILLALPLALLGARGSSPDPDALPPEVAAALQGVVSVKVREVENVPVFRDGRFVVEPIEGRGAGSGVVVSEQGLILTNAHVVEGGSAVLVRFPSGEEADAQVLSVDEASDLALLRAGSGPFRPVPFADDGLPQPGSAAFVIGDRAEAGPSVSWARIGRHRHVRVGARPLEFWCAVEAQIGPGNSGGAVVDADGRLLGMPALEIHYAAASPRAALPAAGLFIPASHLRRALLKMTQGPTAIWPWIGLLLDDPLLAASEGRRFADDQAPTVRRVLPGSPAEQAGLLAGDRIISIGSRHPRDGFDALDAVLDLAPGGKVGVGIERGGKRLAIVVTAGRRPPDPRPDPVDDFALHTGVRLEKRLDPADGREMLALAGLSPGARSDLLPSEAGLFASGPILSSLLPGQDALAGGSRRIPITSPEDLSPLVARCFVGDQFVALAHWTGDGRETVDRAHVHRKIYPLVL